MEVYAQSPPRKVGRGAVETLYQEVFKLTYGLTQFFEKVEEKFGLPLVEHDLLKLLGNDVDSRRCSIRPVENDADIERMKNPRSEARYNSSEESPSKRYKVGLFSFYRISFLFS